MKSQKPLVLLGVLVVVLCISNQPAKCQPWWWDVVKSGEIDYCWHIAPPPYDSLAVDGMPDFDQKQDAWHDASGNWNWCGPVATANCLWWFDSKFERIRIYSLGLGPPVRPPTISDHYNLVYSFNSAWDDHDPSNLMPFINNLVTFLPGGGVPSWGVTASEIKMMIQHYLASLPVNLWGHYTAKVVWYPDFEYIYEQVEASQDVILLLGFWQTDGVTWWRFGGHWVTVAGVWSDGIPTTPDSISFSDPYKDIAELGFPGVVWDGFLIPHPGPPHPTFVHNDAGNVSHDYYGIVDTSGSPGGIISCTYGHEYAYDDWMNFFWKNFPPRLEEYAGYYYDNWPVHVEIEDLVVVCPNFDYGDLHPDYPTKDIESCGPGHPLTDKAWLGDSINAELQPRILDLDNFDDGVIFHNLPWTPCANERVSVVVTTGAHYVGEDLYLNAWKDGNIDGDFDDGPGANEDDWLCCSEWIIMDAPVVAGLNGPFVFCDPGLTDTIPYDLRARFRLTSQPVGRFGYGGFWGAPPGNGWGTYDLDWELGEVEDYILADQQLAVELKSFNAAPGNGEVILRWVTASEQDNECFLVHRRHADAWARIADIPSRGNSETDQTYEFTDRDVMNGVRYEYRLTARDVAGVVEELATAAATPTAAVIPLTYALYQNFPNPFNATTAIRFDVKERGLIDLSVFDITGRRIETLVHEELAASQHTVTFDAGGLPSGVYFYRLEAGDFVSTKKMVLLK